MTSLLNVELLESRVVPAITLGVNEIIIRVPDGTVNIVYLTSLSSSTSGDKYRVVHYSGPRIDATRLVDLRIFTQQQVTGSGKIIFHGGSGADYFTYQLKGKLPHLRVEAYGNGGHDRFVGGPLNDILEGGDGVDVLNGERGNDFLFGGDDGDDLNGGPGVDVLMGGFGADNLWGGSENDQLYGYMSSLEAEKRNEIFHQDADTDHLYGQTGSDGFRRDLLDLVDFNPNDPDEWLLY